MDSEYKIENLKWYDIKSEIAEFIVHRLKDYKKNFYKEGVCIPAWVESNLKEEYNEKEINDLNERWSTELDKMIKSFYLINNHDESIDNQEETIQTGIDLFAKYFKHLWD